MVSVASLLNPTPSVFESYRRLPSPHSTEHLSERSSPAIQPYKKQKVAKDAAIFVKGKVVGEVRYSPWDSYDETTANELRSLRMYPMGQISTYHRHIPYNSEKKSFLEKTGRGAFEVFQYTFKLPSDEREYTVMWDYNIGLVRVTPFFRSCQYAKTIPAKMLNSNPGLREICHSITGGALAAQGYWMPFEAAKAIAATFCYSIRYALIPIFGPDFLSLCVEPSSDHFGHMVIDPRIVRECTAEAKRYYQISCREDSTSEGRSTPTPFSKDTGWMSKPLRPTPATPTDTESGYYTDTERREQSQDSARSTIHWVPPTPQLTEMEAGTESPSKSLCDSFYESRCDAPPNSPDSSADSTSPREKRSAQEMEEQDAEDDERISTIESMREALLLGRPLPASTRKLKAAQTLLQLYFADTTLKDDDVHCSKKKRRASS